MYNIRSLTNISDERIKGSRHYDKSKESKINIKGTEITMFSQREDEYMSLTDLANSDIPATVISHWPSKNFAMNYMGLWEQMNNPNFNLTGLHEVKMDSTETSFALSPK